MSAQKQGRKIVLVGATGSIGKPTLDALIAAKIHTITVITRPDSTADLPSSGIARVERGEYTDAAFLARALAGQNVLVMQLAVTAMESQAALIESAAAAGIKLVLPTEFGSDPDPSNPMLRDMPMLSGKKKYRDLIEAKGMAWTAVANNPWFDWSLARGLWGFDVAKRTAKIYDGGRARFVTTNIATSARATAGLLGLPDEQLGRFRNRAVYLQSYRITQRDVFASVLRATGTEEKDWDVLEAGGEETVANPPGGWLESLYVLHMIEGRGGDYGDKVGDTMELAGAVEKETLDEAVARVLKEME